MYGVSYLQHWVNTLAPLSVQEPHWMSGLSGRLFLSIAQWKPPPNSPPNAPSFSEDWLESFFWELPYSSGSHARFVWKVTSTMKKHLQIAGIWYKLGPDHHWSPYNFNKIELDEVLINLISSFLPFLGGSLHGTFHEGILTIRIRVRSSETSRQGQFPCNNCWILRHFEIL